MFWWRKKEKNVPAHLKTGIWGEKQAARMLKKAGCRILGKRVRIGRYDEIDLIVRDGETLVFVEVKTRSGEQFGRPISAVDRGKIHSVSRAAARYIKKLKTKPKYIRFDVVEVIGTPDSDTDPKIRHIKAAFTMSRQYHLQW